MAATAEKQEPQTAEPAPQAVPEQFQFDVYNQFMEEVATDLETRAKSIAARSRITFKALNWGDLFAKLIEALMGCFGGAMTPAKLKRAAKRPGIFGQSRMRRAMDKAKLSDDEGAVVIEALLDKCKQASDEVLATFCAAYET